MSHNSIYPRRWIIAVMGDRQHPHVIHAEWHWGNENTAADRAVALADLGDWADVIPV